MEQIGRGGSGTVYRAYQTAFRRQVAIKVLSVGSSDDTTIRRFRREVGAVGSLSGHPHIVVVHDIGTTEQGDPYLVMAYLAGGTLGDKLEAEGPIPARDVAAWTIKLAGALEAAHRAGVLHLDVKPDNVLFDEFDEPQLVDFGIARLEGVTHSRSGHLKATPLYAAPEVLSGARPSAGADVYSLAATAYAALRGRPAFLEDTDETLAPMLTRVLTQPPEPLPRVVASPPIWAVLARGLSKDPIVRHASAEEFGRDLQAAQREVGLPVSTMTIPGGRGDVDTDTAPMDPAPRKSAPDINDDLNRTIVGSVATPPPGVTPPRDATPSADDRQPPHGNRRRARTSWILGLAAAAVLVTAGGLLVASALSDDGDGTDSEDPVLADIAPGDVDAADPRSPSAENPAARPTDLVAQPLDDGEQVHLTWTNNSPAAQGVAVQVDRRVVTVLAADQEELVIRDIDPASRTCFLVGAVGRSGDSWVEEPACVVAGPPAAPTDLTAERGDGEYVVLDWSDESGNERGFQIVQDEDIVARLGADRRSAQVDDVDERARACFTVVAVNEEGRSPSEDACVSVR